MSRHGLVRDAAIVAQRWSMDIIDVLSEPDDLLWSLRVAGHLALNRIEEQARASHT